MSKESSYTLLQNKRWRAITYNWEILAEYGNTPRLYCLTDFQVAWLLSNTDYFAWSTRWSNCPCTEQDMLNLKAEMEYNLMSCSDFQPYQLEAIYENSNNGLLQQYTNNWDGSLPSSVNANAPDDFFNGDDSPDRNNALCTAVTMWTYSYAVDWSTKASIILGLIYAGASILDTLIPVGGKIVTQVVTDMNAPAQATLDALNDQASLDQVICDWVASLEGIAITPSNWESTMAGLSYPVMSNSWYIQQLLSSDTSLLANFLSFVNSLGNAYEFAQLGVFICPCDDPWIYDFDFTLADGVSDGWYQSVWGNGWVSGKGWSSEYFGSSPNQQNLQRLMNDFSANSKLTYIEYEIVYDGTATNYGTDINSQRLATIVYLSAVPQINESFITSGQPIQTSVNQYDDPAGVVGDQIELVWNPTLESPNLMYLSRVIIHGVGFNPFA